MVMDSPFGDEGPPQLHVCEWCGDTMGTIWTEADATHGRCERAHQAGKDEMMKEVVAGLRLAEQINGEVIEALIAGLCAGGKRKEG